MGTGFFLDGYGDGWLVTDYHVVIDAVFQNEGRRVIDLCVCSGPRCGAPRWEGRAVFALGWHH